MNTLKRVLVVDDEPDICDMLREILEMEGFEVETATRSENAFALVRENPPDIAVLDVLLKDDINGVEIFKKIKNLSPDTKTIMMTAFSVQELLDEAIAQGAVAALSKPLALESFIQMLDEL